LNSFETATESISASFQRKTNTTHIHTLSIKHLIFFGFSTLAHKIKNNRCGVVSYVHFKKSKYSCFISQFKIKTHTVGEYGKNPVRYTDFEAMFKI